ncbi:MAG: FKBP-type peptidyl-prolyl cis-trans isomerase [Propionibacteriaceae bacterium]|jgi:peptidylprolyl isomerase|nr:FKBP-type peptidyl-prolyl cis-trans isomerase [Propionibacteriaceae bacterium]
MGEASMIDVRALRLGAAGAVIALGLTLAACSSPSVSPSNSPSPSTASADATLGNDTQASALPSDDSSTSPSPTPSPTVSQPPASTNLDGVEATGGFGESPTVTVPSPWAIDSTQTKVLVQGDGPTVPKSGYVQVNYYGVDARTGETFDESYSSGTPANFSLNGVVAGFQKGLSGQQVGSRVLIAMPGADGYDANGGQADAGIALGDTLIFVVDILRTQFDEPTGTTVTPTDASLPVVAGTVDAPTITIPEGATAPTSLVVQDLVVGEGPAVVATDAVVINYAEYLWDGGKLVRQTYGYAPLTGMLSSTIPGWQQALVGKTAGSRIELVVPADQAYPDGAPKLDVPAGSTMVYLIDVLYSWTPSA